MCAVLPWVFSKVQVPVNKSWHQNTCSPVFWVVDIVTHVLFTVLLTRSLRGTISVDSEDSSIGRDELGCSMGIKFSNASRNHKFQVVKIKLSATSSILVLFRKVILKWVGVSDYWEGQVENKTKCGKIVIFPGLNRAIFSVCPWHIRTPPLHLF